MKIICTVILFLRHFLIKAILYDEDFYSDTKAINKKRAMMNVLCNNCLNKRKNRLRRRKIVKIKKKEPPSCLKMMLMDIFPDKYAKKEIDLIRKEPVTIRNPKSLLSATNNKEYLDLNNRTNKKREVYKRPIDISKHLTQKKKVVIKNINHHNNLPHYRYIKPHKKLKRKKKYQGTHKKSSKFDYKIKDPMSFINSNN